MAEEPVPSSGVRYGGGDIDGGDRGGGGSNPAVAVQPGWHHKNEEAVDGLFPNTAALSVMERQINCNIDTAFYGVKNINTKIFVCHVCKHILLQFAASTTKLTQGSMGMGGCHGRQEDDCGRA